MKPSYQASWIETADPQPQAANLVAAGLTKMMLNQFPTRRTAMPACASAPRTPAGSVAGCRVRGTLCRLLLALLCALAGTAHVVGQCVPKSFGNKTTADGLGSNFVNGVFASGSTVYAATFGGLALSTNGGASFGSRTTADGLGDNQVRGVFASGSAVSAATSGGLSLGSCNSAPAITALAQTVTAGSLSAQNRQIATVSDADQTAGSLTVTITSANPFNGVTLANLTNTGGNIFADVLAACGATTTSFMLTVTDSAGAAANATLNVTVNANTPPVLAAYPASTTVSFGAATTTIMPNMPPSDNGSLSTITASAPGFNGTFAVNLVTGVVTVSNASPAGSVTVTVTATDNCGAPSPRTFTLVVNCPTLVEVLPKPTGPGPTLAFALPAARVGQPYTTTISATPAGGNYSFSLTPSPNQLPAGLMLNPSTGVISGTTAAIGNYVFRIYATPAGGCAGASRLYSLRVNP